MVDSTRVDRTLAAAREHFRAPLEAREQVRAALAASGQLPAGSALGASLAGRASPGARASGMAKSTAALLAGLTFIAGFWLGRVSEPAPREPASPSPSAAQAPSAAVPAAEATEAAGTSPPSAATQATETPASPGFGALAMPSRALDVPRALPKPQPAAARIAKAARATRRRASLGEELTLLQRAEHAIRSGQPELALAFLDDLEQRHPETQLGEERTAARLMARCARAEAGASAEAARFLQSRRASVYSDRVRELCGLEPALGTSDGNGSPGH